MGDARLVVGGWMADADGPGYYRMRVPMDALAKRGHSVHYAGVLPWRHGRRPVSHVLVGQRISNVETSAKWLRAAGDVRRVFEVDDDLLNVDPSSVTARAFYGDPSVRRRLLENIRSADAVTVSTPYLAEVVRGEYGVTAPIHVVPNCLEREALELPPVDQAGPVTIGWSGSDTHRGDFEHVRGPLRRFFAARRDVSMTFIGADYSGLVGSPSGRVLSWLPIWDSPAAYMRRLDWQIGLAPLANTQFNRCKSALKALEYAARGIVVVASDVEPYRRFVQHGATGFLVEQDHEWRGYLELLVGDEQLRAQMAAAAREQAAGWCIDDHAHLWEQAYSA